MKSHRRLCIFSPEVLVNSAEMSVEIIALQRQRDHGWRNEINNRTFSFRFRRMEERVKR